MRVVILPPSSSKNLSFVVAPTKSGGYFLHRYFLNIFGPDDGFSYINIEERNGTMKKLFFILSLLSMPSYALAFPLTPTKCVASISANSNPPCRWVWHTYKPAPGSVFVYKACIAEKSATSWPRSDDYILTTLYLQARCTE